MSVALPLGYLRSVQGLFLTERATIARFTSVSTSDGDEQTWAAIATDVPCRLSQPTSSATEDAGAANVVRAVSSWRIWLPFDQDVTAQDRVTVHATDRTDERTFEVERVDEKTNETARRCLLTLRE